MGLDMYLYRCPKVLSVKELNGLNEKLTKDFYDGKIEDSVKEIHKSKGFIMNFPIEIESRLNIDKDKWLEWKKEGENYNSVECMIKICYWRKFNALHNWMVNNVQDKEDNCEMYIVTEEKLIELQKTLEKISPDNADELLPTGSGFFFGSTEYDEYYFKQLENLKSVLVYLLTQIDFNETSLIYSSSW